MDRQAVTLLVLIDLSAAFNTIDHAILLETLEKDFGETGNALKWLASYLSERKQTILIKDHESEVFNLQSGVPQGSCLGPVLFILYVAGLFKIIYKHLPNAHTYADDTQIYQYIFIYYIYIYIYIYIYECCGFPRLRFHSIV